MGQASEIALAKSAAPSNISKGATRSSVSDETIDSCGTLTSNTGRLSAF